MPPIRQEFDNLQPNELDEVISDDRQQAYQTAMCITMLIFDAIVEPYMPDRVRGQFGAKQGIPRNPLVVSKRASRQDILQPDIQEEEDGVSAHEPQYIMRPRGYEDELVSEVQASTVMLAEALTVKQKWYPEIYNHINNVFVTLSKFMLVDMGDVEARMEVLQRQHNVKVYLTGPDMMEWVKVVGL
ncbi:hypothetical protein AMTR_s00108p00146810 [Amborella trichopoda]|uniref:Uncharacterized protein n=1 Tax=Amborella trichopoda TaxID=13333 RepID=W1NUT5_AMBTC|nr:hypothetical protein AMTR_s00108p00146810 [Amborella trichopoda]